MKHPGIIGYAELHAISNFTFLRGASHPEELVSAAAALGYRAIAITDECSLAGVVRAHVAAREQPIDLLVGSEFDLGERLRLVLLATDRSAYGALSTFVTRARRRSAKGEYRVEPADFGDGVGGCLAVFCPGADAGGPSAARDRLIGDIAEACPGRAWVAVELHRGADDRARMARSRALAGRLSLPLVAAGDAHMHARSRRALQHVLTAIREHAPVADAGLVLHPNAERHLRPREELRSIYPRALLDETLAIAERCRFSLDELRYEYPRELAPEGVSLPEHLRSLVEAGMVERWPQGAPPKARRLVEHELALVSELGYEPYFLTVHDVVRFARERGILCQGRGSAANSAVCFCLGITEVDPGRMEMLFERFISRERDEPPDIDVDFEHERREEVIQYIYRKYGRDRAAIAATVITYRPRSAIRDVGKALGLDLLQVDRLAKSLSWWDGCRVLRERFRDLGFDPDARVTRLLAKFVDDLVGFPRHLSQHTGGFVISRDSLATLVPIENAAMPERTVIQWDKDDLESLGLLKVDVLALGMLSAIRKSFDLLARHRGERMSMAAVPAEDPAVYEMIGHADTVGVFQIESRAQMAMLPRMKPRTFYDLVIEVAIVRPGPIQGGMVHPYLRRRQGLEPVTYPSPAVESVLARTLGVPIFQEQVMQLAVVAAGFSPGEADRLRRAMAAFRRRGSLGPFEARLVDGMRERGYSETFARQIFEQIKGFGEYGFPESHSASFALLVYVSAWLKCHRPAAFTAALLNAQPMGFYAPAQLIRDAVRHGVEVRPVDIARSEWDCTLETGAGGAAAIRLGFRMIKGFREASARRIEAARAGRGAAAGEESAPGFARSADLERDALVRLADAGALRGICGDRHRAHWAALEVESPGPLLPAPRFSEAEPMLPVPTEGESIVADYRHQGFTLGRHPLALLRGRLEKMGLSDAGRINASRHGARCRVAGLVINRQRPSTASGVVFATLEDETGHINLVVWPWLTERQRRVLLQASLLGVDGTIEREGEVIHLIARRLTDHSALLGQLETRSRDFR